METVDNLSTDEIGCTR